MLQHVLIPAQFGDLLIVVPEPALEADVEDVGGVVPVARHVAVVVQNREQFVRAAPVVVPVDCPLRQVLCKT